MYVIAVPNATRTGKYSYVNVKASAVYPTGNYSTDNFTRCKTKLGATTGEDITNSYTLTEGAAFTKLAIKEGYLDKKTFNLKFCGNNYNYAAVIQYSYDGKEI